MGKGRRGGKGYRGRTSSAAIVTVWFVTMTGRIVAFTVLLSDMSHFTRSRKEQQAHLTVRDTREQEDRRGEGAEELLRRGEEVVAYAALTG